MTVPFTTAAPGLDLPRGVRFWTDDDMVREHGDGPPTPTFSPVQTAELFYGRTGRWLNMTLLEHRIEEHELGTVRRYRTQGRLLSRRYTLHNIERLTHQLVAAHAIDGRQAMAAVMIVKGMAIAHGWGLLIERKEQSRDGR